MKTTVLYAGLSGPRSRALIDTLRAAGNQVQRVRGLRDVLLVDAESVGVLVIDTAGEPGSDNQTGAPSLHDLLLLEELQTAGVSFPVVLVTGRIDSELCGRARELGAAIVLQQAFDPTGLTLAVQRAERTGPAPSDPAASAVPPTSILHRVEYSLQSDTLRDAVRDLTAYLARRDVCLPHLVRIACATAELIENSIRYAGASPNGTTCSVEARVESRGVHVTVHDDGDGFDADLARLESVPAPLPTKADRKAPIRPTARPGTTRGLARAAYLSEQIRFDTDTGSARIELAFELAPVRSAGTLPATDDLLPESTRTWLAGLERGEHPDLPEAFSLTARRLSGGTPTNTPVIQRG